MGEEAQLAQQGDITSAFPLWIWQRPALDWLWYHQSCISRGFLFGPACAPGTWHCTLSPDTFYWPYLEKAPLGICWMLPEFLTRVIGSTWLPFPSSGPAKVKSPTRRVCMGSLLTSALQIWAVFSECTLVLSQKGTLLLIFEVLCSSGLTQGTPPYPVMIKWS